MTDITYTSTPRSTIDSLAEGRLKVDVGRRIKNKRKIVKKKIKQFLKK